MLSIQELNFLQIMEISNNLSVNRMALLYKQAFFISGKQMLIIFGSTVGIIAGFHTFIHLVNYRHLANTIDDQYHLGVFLFAFIGGSLIWCGQAFPAFRSKEKSMEYLMTPSSTLEKFLFEFINRVIIYIILFPIIYWIITNTITSIFHAFNSAYMDYKFEFGALLPGWEAKEMTLALSLAFLIFTIPFTGATYFNKMPLLKTILTVFFLVGFYFGLGFLIVLGLNLEEYRPAEGGILFMKNEADIKLAGIMAAILANLTLLTISYFKVKEKEV